MQQISPIKEKILKYLDLKGVSKYKFYQDSGITRGVLDKESGISEDNIAKFIAYEPQVNLEWLLTGEGEIFKTKNEENLIKKKDKVFDKVFDNKRNVKNTLSILEEEKGEYQKIMRKIKFAENVNLSEDGAPYYPLPISAGQTVELLKEVEKPTGFISIPGVHCKAYFPVIGCSFEPLIRAGDIIGINFIDNWEVLDPDCLYYIITHDQRMLKRLMRHPTKEGTLLCISPNYKEFSIDIGDIKTVHKVVFYGRLV